MDEEKIATAVIIVMMIWTLIRTMKYDMHMFGRHRNIIVLIRAGWLPLLVGVLLYRLLKFLLSTGE